MWIIIGSLYFEWEGPTDNYGQGPTDNYGQGPTDNCGSTEWSIIGTHKVGGTHSNKVVNYRDPLRGQGPTHYMSGRVHYYE